MSTLLLRLAGPMQSWGEQSRFSIRDTCMEPTKSGVIGLVCAALGRGRSEPLADLTALGMGVRVDREGRMACDYHTSGGSHRVEDRYGVIKADGSAGDTVVSRRYYLADAHFLVGLEGDRPLLERIHSALRGPVWSLSLGRKSFVPAQPVWLEDGLRADQSLREALVQYPWCPPRHAVPDRLRMVLECVPGQGEVRNDVPLSFADRRFSVRRVRTEFCPPPGREKVAVCS